MIVERIPAGDRETWLALRQQDVTASTVAALFNVHDYVTAFELFALKKGLISEDVEDSPPLQRGRLLEPIAVQLLRERHPDWKITHNTGSEQVYLRDPSIRLGATIDVFVEHPERGPGVVQLKSVEGSIFRKKWMDEFKEVSVPLAVATQVITEAHLAQAQWAMVGALVVGFGVDLHECETPIHAGMIGRIRQEVEKFWAIVDSGEPMQPDYARDGDALAKVYSRGDEPDIDLTGDEEFAAWIVRRDSLKARIDEATGDLDTVKNQVKARLGNAAIARCGSRMVTWKVVNKREYIVPASSNRTLLFK